MAAVIHEKRTDAVVQTRSLCRTYGNRRGVQDVDLSIRGGQIFGFLGPNGAGKSTTIRLLLGFLKASGGTASIFGMDCWSASARIKQDVGYVAGDVRLSPWLTLNKALRIVGHIRNKDLQSEGMRLAERFRMEPDLPVRKMSRGNRQKVALVLALVHRPKLVILDEPTSGLDPLMQDTLGDCLKEIASSGGTVFFSSHTLSEVESLCDRIAIVRDGRIVVDDSLRELKQQAPRTIAVDLPPEIAADTFCWPDFLVMKHHFRQHCELELNGPVAPFVRWAATQQFTDLSISPPSLEALFRAYYEPAQLTEETL